MLPAPVRAFVEAEVAASATDFTDLRVLYLNGTLKRSPGAEPHLGARRGEPPRHGGGRRDGRRGPHRRPRHPARSPAGHARARVADRRLPRPLPPARRARRHRRRRHPDLARRPGVGDPARHRAALRLEQPAQRRRPVVVLRQGRRRPRHRQRGRWQALRRPDPLRPVPHRLHDPAAGRLLLGRRGRPGPSYLDDDRGAHNHWTTRNTVFAAWNMLHTARRLKDAGGVPAHGNVTTNWNLADPDHPNPEYR